MSGVVLTDSLRLPALVAVGAALVALLNLVALSVKRAARIALDFPASTPDAPTAEVVPEGRLRPAADGVKSPPMDAPSRDVLPKASGLPQPEGLHHAIGQGDAPQTPGRAPRQMDEIDLKSSTIPDVWRTKDKVTCADQRVVREPVKDISLAAWQQGRPAQPRLRLGPLPSRRHFGSSGTLKQPRGLASCVIREDMPYPPANAEVTLEVKTTTVRHGRKILRYSASSPLDTIYIKIPNTSPSGLPVPILDTLRHTIDLGNQRIVVGGGLRPGCALLSVDLLSVESVEEEAAEEVQGSAAAGSEARGGGYPGAQLSLGEVVAAAGGSGGAAALEKLSASLNTWLHGMGVAATHGLKLQLQCRGAVVEAVYDDQLARWAFAAVADTSGDVGGVLGQGPQPRSAVRFMVSRQILVAPVSVGEAVKVSVRVSGPPDLTSDEGAGRYSFSVRALGRHLPVLGVPAPTTPALDSAGSMEADEGPAAAGGGAEGSVAAAGWSPDPAGATAVTIAAAAVAAVTAAAAAVATGGDVDDDGSAADSVAKNRIAVLDVDGDGEGDASAAGVPVTTFVGRSDASEAAAGGGAAAAAGRPSGRRGSRGPPHTPVYPYELAVAGLGSGRGGARPGPLLLQLELWRDSSRMLAAKPLLLLPAVMSAMAVELAALVAQQQEEDEEEQGGVDGAEAAAAAEPSAADQLVTDLGMWLEFVHDNLQVAAAEAAEAAVTEPGAPSGERGSSSSSRGPPAALLSGRSPRPATASSILLSGSVDLREEVLEGRRRQPAYAATMLRVGLALLEAVVSYGCVPLAERLMADFEALGYDVAEVWRASGGAAAAADGPAAAAAATPGPSLLHLAAASGDVAMLRTAAAWAQTAAAAAEGGRCASDSPLLLRNQLPRTPDAAAAAAALKGAPGGYGGGGAAAQPAAGGSGALGSSGSSSGSSTGSSSGSWWGLRDGQGLTPLHVLAASDGLLAAAALQWALDSGGDGARRAWCTARDAAGLTPQQLAAQQQRGVGASWLRHVGQLVPPPAADQEPAHLARQATGCCQVPSRHSEGGAAETPAQPGGGNAHSTGRRSVLVAAARLLWACLAGFEGQGNGGSSGSSGSTPVSRAAAGTVTVTVTATDGGDESRYQAFVTSRTLPLCRVWVVVHLMLLCSALSRTLREQPVRRGDLPAPLLFSSAYFMMLAVMNGVPGYRLYLPHRGGWWCLTSALRTSAKVTQLAGWVQLPASTLRYVQQGATLVSDCVLPAMFEPCPLPYAVLVLLYDFIVTTLFFQRIGYTSGLSASLLGAVRKCCIGFTIRLTMDLHHRYVYLRSAAASPAAAARYLGARWGAVAGVKDHQD